MLVSCAALAICLSLTAALEPAFAQNSGRPVMPPPEERGSGFNPFRPLMRLFGVTGPQRPVQEQKPVARQAPAQPAVPAGTPPAFAELPKDPDAGVILVVGDRMAQGVKDGLAFTLAQKPVVRIDGLIETGRGLAGATAPAWNERVLARLRGDNVKAVVVMLGWHDLIELPGAAEPLPFGSEAWIAAYGARVKSLVQVVRQERKPVVWVGLPPAEAARTDAEFTLLNRIFQQEVEAARGVYVDISKVFLDDDEKYAAFGPDVDGQRRRLRTQDGIAFTWAGYRKVAFFVERELSRLLGGYGGLAFEGVEDDPNFIVLTGRTASPEDELVGEAGAPPAPEPDSLRHRFFVRGESLEPVAGRVDDTRLPAGSVLR
ncbi:GDSL-type esterase/lipase family protein [Polymorphum gilvum]|uniref:Uncharacterized protein n=1 Tax=Polymorphum gilvum (strain LMG 25793 / CGMCC 1.9160 / SL003B-26A1) TaxID=991905 RepID=F2IWH7_POLGS|nr:GDSL-type esterase/lipase family protein [Polymorphum gilvum]ADZ69276.1 hypothetical protein SL003B_0846 [Polymorphum gilvum SL003B-26A1]